jgi:GT2 family glycosyltransferase
MTSPKVSVIVLGYNGRDYLGPCFDSLLDLDPVDGGHELVYADNNSQDGSADLIERNYPSVRVLRFDRNHGFAEGYNRAVREVKGAYIGILNQDTVCHRRWLAELSRALDEHPEAAAVHSNVLTPFTPGYERLERVDWPGVVLVSELTRFGFVGYEQRPFTEEPIETIFLAGAASMVRREVVERDGYLFECALVAYCEDTDLALRLRNAGHVNLLVPKAVVYHDLTPTTGLSLATLRKTLMIVRNRFLAFFKNMGLLEFAGYAPVLAVGAPLKPGELSLGKSSLLYALGMIPLVPIAMVWAILEAPKVWSHRFAILASRRLPRFGMLRLMLGGRS